MTRIRKRADEARTAILEAAHKHLVEGGPNAVKMLKIAADLGITDAAIHYHFRNRQSLLVALLKHSGAQLKERVGNATMTDVENLAKELEAVYSTQGCARLAMWLSLEGWESKGENMFANLVEAWRERYPSESVEEIRFQIAFLNLVMAAEPLMGGSFLRSVGMADTKRNRRRFHNWIVRRLQG
jgi:AcrR family transcriptional regulator